MDVAGAGVVGIAHEQIHVADDRRLVREVPNVSREIFVHAESTLQSLELDRALSRRRQALDVTIDLVLARRLDENGATIGEREIVDGVGEKGVRCGSDDEASVVLNANGTDAVVEQILAGDAVSERNRSGR
jgi:hypothetical protein